MCGVAGIVAAQTGRVNLRLVAEQMQAKLTHRGPDDRGQYVCKHGHSALVHNRLSILDLSSAGHQPMQDRETGNWIVYNGEIYNYRSLREELDGERQGLGVRGEALTPKLGCQRSEVCSQTSEIRGQRSDVGSVQSAISHSQGTWSSNSDTEVILRAYAKWGRNCVNHLRGMFAFAIWDERQQELFMARDPFGIKPLYFYQSESLFLFASEVRALLASDLVPRKLSQDGLASYLQYGSVQDPMTIVDDVRSLLPGHGLVVKCQGNRLEVKEFSFQSRFMPDALTSNGCGPYPFVLGNPPSTRSEAVAVLRAKLEESVRLHLVSDVSLGAFLSGGIDSSAIVALMSRIAGQRPKTFSVVFEESEFSEGEHAKLVARKFGTEHHEILLSEQSLLDMLPSALEAMDQPTMDGINTYVISKAVRDAGVKVALSGLGGDELFAGYPSFRRAQQLHRLAIMPLAIRQFASYVGHSALNGSARWRKFWDLVDSDCSPYAAYSLSRQLFSGSEISALRSSTARDQRSEVRGQLGDQGAGRREQGAPPDASRLTPYDLDVISTVSGYELCGYMSNTLLRDSDQMSMAHALEVRVPFVDPAVVSFVLGLPGEWKIDGNRPKPLLVDALGDLLPEEIWKRRKMGFTLPFQKWMRAGLESEINRDLSDKNGLERIGLNGDETGAIWAAFKNNPQQEPWSRPWALYVLKQWCERNRVAM